MLSSTTKYLIVLDEKDDDDKYVNYIANSAKIDYSVAYLMPTVKTQLIKRCTTSKCGAILSTKDRSWLWQYKQYQRNYDLFMKERRLPSLAQLSVHPNNKIWICRFCGNHQPINPLESHFMDTCVRYKAPAQKAVSEQESPVIIFVVDWSSSMQMSAFGDKKSTSTNNSHQKHLLKLIKQSDLSQQLIKKEKQLYNRSMCVLTGQQVQSKRTNNKSPISRSQMLLGIVEKALKQIIRKIKNGNVNSETSKLKFGFIFFNDFLFLNGDCMNPDYPIIYSSETYETDSRTIEYYCEQAVRNKRIQTQSYNSYQKLFKCGQDKRKFYQTSLKTLEIQDMRLNDIIPQGQTALGPALAVALGIVSTQGQGSSIMIVTDGLANNGILSDGKNLGKDVQKIVEDLYKSKCSLGILQWQDQVNKGQPNSLDKLQEMAPDIVKKYEVKLSTDKQRVQVYVDNIIQNTFRGRIVAQVVSKTFLSNVDFIKLQKSQQVKEQVRTDLISAKQVHWMDIHLDVGKVDPLYFNKCPIYTQLTLEINKLGDRQLYCHVSQIQQYLAKNKNMMFEDLKVKNLKERISRCQIMNANSMRFQTKSINSVNNSIMSYNKTHKDYELDLDKEMDANEKYKKAVGFNMTYKQSYDLD